MPIIEGTTQIKTAAGEYDFATDGGAVGSITLRSAGGASLGAGVPAGSVITGGYVEVDTALTSGGSATVARRPRGSGSPSRCPATRHSWTPRPRPSLPTRPRPRSGTRD
jgi:hypothetical protein